MKRPPALRLSVHLPSWLRLRLCLRVLFVATVGAVLLPGCVTALLLAGSTDISKDGRFTQVLGRGVRTRVEMRLYAPDSRGPDDMRTVYDLTNVRGGAEDLVAMLPAGYAVRFDRAVRKRTFDGGTSEYLSGEIAVRGRSYPMHYYLGSGVYPEGWRRMHEVFEMRK